MATTGDDEAYKKLKGVSVTNKDSRQQKLQIVSQKLSNTNILVHVQVKTLMLGKLK